MPKCKVTGSRMKTIPEINENIYIIENSPLEGLLFNRSRIGLEFTKYCESASCYFLRHFEEELRNQGESLAELMILSKGYYYWFHNAFARIFKENLQINFVATNRVQVFGDKAHIFISYYNFDAPADQLLIGDTIASGATICSAIDAYLQVRPVKKVFIFSIAGSKIGAERIAQFCEERQIEYQCVFGLALFGLGENGFDLSFLHPDTITSPKYLRIAKEVYKGMPISVAGWDFGSQSQSPQKYRMLSWIESQKWHLEGSELFKESEMPRTLNLINKEKDAYIFLPLPPESEKNNSINK